MIKTLSIRDIEKKATNIYEAIVVLAKRARQINDDQKQERAAERDYEDEYGGYGEEEYPVEVPDDFEDLPKPTAIALEEFLQDKVKFNYLEDKKGEEMSRPSES